MPDGKEEKGGKMEIDLPFLTTRKVFTVSEFVHQVAELLEAHFGTVFIEGEITNLRQPASGHLYLTLKDSQAQIKGIVFRRQARILDFTPEEGMAVTCRGRLNIYEARGDLQVIIDYMEPSGRGADRVALEKLKKKLAAEGLFDESRKKPLPSLPRVIGVITSPTGAAIRDILKVIRRKNEKVTVLIYPVRVQGDLAPREIAEGLAYFNRHRLADVLIVGRGGGSAEDLSAFNHESVVRAVAASEIPVISAVGHEIDITLSDLAADRRAPTPTAAAEAVILERQRWIERIGEQKVRLARDFQLIVERKKSRMRELESRLLDPRHRLSLIRMKLDELYARLSEILSRKLQIRRLMVDDRWHRLERLSPRMLLAEKRRVLTREGERLRKGMAHIFQARREKVATYASLLESFNPRNVLKRGYSLTFREATGTILKDAGEVGRGETVRVVLAKGALGCEVRRKIPGAWGEGLKENP